MNTTSQPDPSPGSAATQRVLVVDDNREAADIEAELLKLLGHSVVAAYDGRSALEAVERFKPDVVFLDILMPDMDGRQVARNLRQREDGYKLKLFALSAIAHRVERSEFVFDGYLRKPASAGDFMRVLAED